MRHHDTHQYAYDYANQHLDEHSHQHADQYPDRYAHSHPDEYTDQYADGDSYRHTDQYADKHSDQYTNRYADQHADRDTNEYPDRYANCHADHDPDGDGNQHTDEHANTHGNRNGDAHPNQYGDPHSDRHELSAFGVGYARVLDARGLRRVLLHARGPCLPNVSLGRVYVPVRALRSIPKLCRWRLRSENGGSNGDHADNAQLMHDECGLRPLYLPEQHHRVVSILRTWNLPRLHANLHPSSKLRLRVLLWRI